ncbi:MAG TPA: TIGR03619 family F420-dependent LLM class oxidoreductase, partial [Candidatus Eisenbacteria bacterium]|nr:TIGR03619 family F420-dependent LLM class oxidoreductase [Candidatus Eisenbacteria bacterium]
KDAKFIVPPDRPFFEPLTSLAFLAGCTDRIQLGMSVMVLPYRHPLYWAKIVATLDHLSTGRFILGVGVGWMSEEFDALGAAFAERGKVSDEQLRLLDALWSDEHVSFSGRYYRFYDIAFSPKPFNRSRIPIWIGGEGKPAQRRAGIYGDAWFPYFVSITPRELAARFEYVRRTARDAGRDPERVGLACCLPIELTEVDVPQREDYLSGSPGQIATALKRFERAGVQHIGLQFMIPHWPERRAQIERFAREVLPEFKS